MIIRKQENVVFLNATGASRDKGKVKRYVNLYSVLDDKYLVLKALRHGSHGLTCKQRHACL